jgi:uncharacterized protein YqgC (DUF456 family)
MSSVFFSKKSNEVFLTSGLLELLGICVDGTAIILFAKRSCFSKLGQLSNAELYIVL